MSLSYSLYCEVNGEEGNIMHCNDFTSFEAMEEEFNALQIEFPDNIYWYDSWEDAR